MTVILVPCHLDEHRPDLDYPLEPGVAVTAGLPAGDVWELLRTLYSNVAAQVAATTAAWSPLGHLSDCTTSPGTMAVLRDLDPSEANYLAGPQIRQLPVASLDTADQPGGPLCLHVGLDVIDPAARAVLVAALAGWRPGGGSGAG